MWKSTVWYIFSYEIEDFLSLYFKGKIIIFVIKWYKPIQFYIMNWIIISVSDKNLFIWLKVFIRYETIMILVKIKIFEMIYIWHKSMITLIIKRNHGLWKLHFNYPNIRFFIINAFVIQSSWLDDRNHFKKRLLI